MDSSRIPEPRYGANGKKIGRERIPLEIRLKKFIVVDPVTQCWLWQATIDRNGYGRLHIVRRGDNGRVFGHPDLAHRLSYETFIGPIPGNLPLDHLCHSKACAGGVTCPHRRCINPAHLEAVTPKVNSERGNVTGDAGRAAIEANRKPRTHCRRGHEFTEENTIHRTIGKYKTKYCKICEHIDNTTPERKAKRRKD